MGKSRVSDQLKAHYDTEQDILYLSFGTKAHEAVAEEVGNEVFVRFDPETQQVIDVEFLDFRARLQEAFGPQMKYLGAVRPERLLLPIGG
jgi:uncharacterized protein YuzE